MNPRQKLLDEIGPDGGPYCRHLDSEEECRSFDATCRKLYRFLLLYQSRQGRDNLVLLALINSSFFVNPEQVFLQPIVSTK